MQRFGYTSDGLNVVGFMHRLRDPGARKLSVHVYCRGGVGEPAKIFPASAIPTWKRAPSPTQATS